MDLEAFKEERLKSMNGMAGFTRYFLDQMKAVHLGTYQHQLRTGYFAFQIAKHEGWPNPDAAFAQVVLHDTGKIQVALNWPGILDIQNPSEKHQDIIRNHVEYGGNILEMFDFGCAIVAGDHHSRQKHARYEWSGKGVPDIHYINNIDNILLAALCDCFDAAHRQTKLGLTQNTVDPAKTTAEMYPNQPNRIELLSRLDVY